MYNLNLSFVLTPVAVQNNLNNRSASELFSDQASVIRKRSRVTGEDSVNTPNLRDDLRSSRSRGVDAPTTILGA